MQSWTLSKFVVCVDSGIKNSEPVRVRYLVDFYVFLAIGEFRAD